MPNDHWLYVVYPYVLESIVESVIIFLAVCLVMPWRRNHRPASTSRFLLLPLVIPVIISPSVHMLFPQLKHLTLVIQVERYFPLLKAIHQSGELAAPALLLVFFVLCVLNFAQWLVIGLREMRASKRLDPNDFPSDHMVLLESLAARIGVASPGLVISERRPLSAYVFGWRRPIITVGRAWLTRLDFHELEALFAHELAHFKCGDNWRMLIAKGCRDLMFFNPLAHYVYRRWLLACEEAADDRALTVTGRPLALASCLLKFCQVRQRSELPYPATSFTGTGVEQRIHRLMAGSQPDCADHSSDGLFYALSLILTIVLSVI